MSEYQEINFDGLIGPSHNYAGLSFGNVASDRNRGEASSPRAAALQGLAKMRRVMELGIPQGFLPPHERPHVDWLRQLGFGGDDAEVCAAAWRQDPALLRNAMSASAMWTANAATVSPAPDTADGRCHLTVANLATMTHRRLEAPQTYETLRTIFADAERFAVHAPVPDAFGDEGAANHMRLSAAHGEPGIEIFVYGETTSHGFPARQDRRASEAVARLHKIKAGRCVMGQQSARAIQAGAFHNDVVAVANQNVLFTHQDAFAEPDRLYSAILDAAPGTQIVEAPSKLVSLQSAVATYLFNSQLVTTPSGDTVLIAPSEVRDGGPVQSWLEDLIASGGPISQVIYLDVRESMRNGGGPACLRLRVQLSQDDLQRIDQRFVLDARRLERLERLVAELWPVEIAAESLAEPSLWRDMNTARQGLLEELQA